MKRLLVPLLLASLAVACAPKLSIVHEDPTHAYVMVQVDGETSGFVEYGRTLSVRVPAGFHQVATIPRGEAGNPWCEDGDTWTLYVDRKAEITLLPALGR